MVTISRLVNGLIGISSRRLRQEFPDLVATRLVAKRQWSASHFAGSADDAPISVLRLDIEQLLILRSSATGACRCGGSGPDGLLGAGCVFLASARRAAGVFAGC